MSPYMKVMKPDRNFQMQNQFRQPNFLGIRLSLEIRRLKSRCRNIRARHPFPVLICFGNNMDDSHLDLTAGDLINRISFQASQDISSLKNMAGETGKKLTSIASSLINDLQDRIL